MLKDHLHARGSRRKFLRKSFSTVGAELEVSIDRLPAVEAISRRPVLERHRRGSARLVKDPVAVVALEKTFSSFDRDEGNEEKADIVVEALQIS